MTGLDHHRGLDGAVVVSEDHTQGPQYGQVPGQPQQAVSSAADDREPSPRPPGPTDHQPLLLQELQGLLNRGVRGDGLPAPREPDEKSCSGRGLYLVARLAAEFGVDHHVVGTTVRVTFKRP